MVGRLTPAQQFFDEKALAQMSWRGLQVD